MPFFPLAIYAFGYIVVVRAIQKDNLTVIAVIGKQAQEVSLCAPGFREDDSLALTATAFRLIKALLQCGEEIVALGVVGDALRQIRILHEFLEFFGYGGAVLLKTCGQGVFSVFLLVRQFIKGIVVAEFKLRVRSFQEQLEPLDKRVQCA